MSGTNKFKAIIVAYLQLADFHDAPSEIVLESKEIDAVFVEIQLQAAFFGSL